MSETSRLQISVRKPISEWCSGIGFDFRKLFISLASAAVNGVVHKWPEATIKIIEGVGAFVRKDDASNLAWLLITRSLIRTISGIVPLHAIGTLQFNEDQVKDICDRLDLTFQRELLTIDNQFFQSPQDLPLLVSLSIPLAIWLDSLFLSNHPPEDLLRRLRHDFPLDLHDEWIARRDRYEPLGLAFESPFKAAVQREGTWQAYLASLDRDLSTSSLDPNAPLSRCFVPLRGYVSIDSDASTGTPAKKVVEVLPELAAWLETDRSPIPIRLLSGDLGAGKTSLAKTFTREANRSGLYKALFLPVEELPAGELRSSVERVAESYKLPGLISQEGGERHLLLVIDGLEDLPDGNHEQFLDQAARLCRDFNRYTDRLRILVTAKTSVVSTLSRRIRFSPRVIMLLPHYVSEADRDLYLDPDSLLLEDRREAWYRQYYGATGADLRVLRDAISSNEQLAELSVQPLLLHLLAISEDLMKVSSEEQIELTSIYTSLLRGAHERTWKLDSFGVPKLSFEDFYRFFEQLAWQMWQSRQRTFTLSGCRAAIARIANPFPGIHVDSNVDLLRLLDGFFLLEVPNVQNPVDRSFAFVHGGFFKYLTSRRVLAEVSELASQLGPDGRVKAENTSDSHLDRWHSFAGSNVLTAEHCAFIKSELRLRERKDVESWFSCLTALLKLAIITGASHYNRTQPAQFWDDAEIMRNSDEALVVLTHCCALRLDKVIKVDAGQPDRFGHWLSFINGQRRGRDNRLLMSCLEGFDLSECRDLWAQDFLRANLRRSVLSGVKLRWSLLREADLRGALLDRGADLRDCDLQGADLSGADLTGALLQGANLRWSNLEGAVLVDCDFEGADLQGARMRGARCRDASFQRAKLFDLDCGFDEVVDLDLTGAYISSPGMYKSHN